MQTSFCCINDLRDKEVINTCDGRRLGFVTDVEIDLCSGRLTAIMVPGEPASLFGKTPDIRIPWDKIERIGNDTILVCVSELPPCSCDGGGKKKRWFC